MPRADRRSGRSASRKRKKKKMRQLNGIVTMLFQKKDFKMKEKM